MSCVSLYSECVVVCDPRVSLSCVDGEEELKEGGAHSVHGR